MSDKLSVARALLEIATLYRLTGKERFKARAFENGALAVEAAADLGRLVDERRLTELPGVGATLARQIADIWQTGRSNLLEGLRAEVPKGAVELSLVPGLTIKRIRALHSALGIESVVDLRVACEKQLVRTVAGFGPKTEERLCNALARYGTELDEYSLADARAAAEPLLRFARAAPEVVEARLAGAARRYLETMRELDIALASDQPAAALRYVASYPKFASFDLAAARGRLAGGLWVKVHAAVPSAFGAALLRATGPCGYVAAVERAANERGLCVGAGGVSTDGVRARTERELYESLELAYVAPELRDQTPDPRAPTSSNELVEVGDLRGVVHCHTSYSDGRNTIEEMARAAEALGMTYITVTDHSPSAFYAQGVELDRLKRQWDEIADVQERVNVRILRGTESDILADGALDFPDDVLEQFDVIIASIHSRLKMDSAQMTTRLVRCMRLPWFKIWGHALGRLVLRRPPIECDVEAVLDAAAESRVAIEINADPHRLDMAPEWLRRARARGIPFVISTDAHSIRGLGVSHFGVGIARRAAIRKSEVLNTLEANAFVAAVKPS